MVVVAMLASFGFAWSLWWRHVERARAAFVLRARAATLQFLVWRRPPCDRDEWDRHCNDIEEERAALLVSARSFAPDPDEEGPQ
jgi:hypothetical protein